jgi:phosphohistidine phosphatase
MKLLIIRHAIAMERADFHGHTQASEQATGQMGEKRSVKASGAKTNEETDDGKNDEHRPLTPEGMRKMRKNAQGLRELVGRPDLLITSPLTRAVQTASILREMWLDLDVASSDLLKPGASPEALTDWINTRAFAHENDALIAIVGHEPHLSSLASWYLSGHRKSLFELKKGGACLLSFSSDVNRAKAKLEWLVTPGVLRKL